MLLANAWRDWRTALIVVDPDSVVRWHRQWLRRQWAPRSARTRAGRPSTNAAIRARIMKIAAANPLWGAPRIHGELGTLGIAVSERTVSRLVRRPRRPPSQTWRTFLTNHVPARGSMDFFTVRTVTARSLFVFVVLLHHRRRIVHFNVTTCARPKVPLERSRMAAIPNSRADHARVVATTTGNRHPRRFWRRTGQCRCQLSRGVGRRPRGAGESARAQ
jgi:hypothetical protein